MFDEQLFQILCFLFSNFYNYACGVSAAPSRQNLIFDSGQGGKYGSAHTTPFKLIQQAFMPNMRNREFYFGRLTLGCFGIHISTSQGGPVLLGTTVRFML
ncbi:MAG: hypothetical protein P4L50_11845 [Anaerolineaceae bacterium]|nr:hypothetical protein [Anaerolineaceae bacterium]